VAWFDVSSFIHPNNTVTASTALNDAPSPNRMTKTDAQRAARRMKEAYVSFAQTSPIGDPSSCG
jgi:hypothetical protein